MNAPEIDRETWRDAWSVARLYLAGAVSRCHAILEIHDTVRFVCGYGDEAEAINTRLCEMVDACASESGDWLQYPLAVRRKYREFERRTGVAL